MAPRVVRGQNASELEGYYLAVQKSDHPPYGTYEALILACAEPLHRTGPKRPARNHRGQFIGYYNCCIESTLLKTTCQVFPFGCLNHFKLANLESNFLGKCMSGSSWLTVFEGYFG